MQDQNELITKVRADLAAKKGYRSRRIIDFITRYGIKAGGVGVVFAVVLIFFYLISVVLPLFQNSTLVKEPPVIAAQAIAAQDSSSTPSTLIKPSYSIEDSLYFATEEYGEVVTNVISSGEIQFLDNTGKVLVVTQLPLEQDEKVTMVTPVSGKANWLALAISSGKVFIVLQKYRLTYPDGKRKVVPSIEYPLGEEALALSDTKLRYLSSFVSDEQLLIAYIDVANHLKLKSYVLEQDFISDSLTFEEDNVFPIPYTLKASAIMLANDGRWIYITSASGQVALYQIIDDKVEAVATGHVPENAKITTISPLLGDYSILVGDSAGTISQWFGYRDKKYNKLRLTQVRNFQLSQNAITQIIPEKQRKGFLALDVKNNLGVYFTTSHKTLLIENLGKKVKFAALNAHADKLLLLQNNKIERYHLFNEHPEISMSSLWSKVWYESYSEPAYVWQSSASNNDFEPKFSLAPLTYGTLKAAIYALVFAIPLALFGAIYTAYFMSPKLRSTVKPTIEIMEALPTVILGFLAGLWLAPFIEIHLTGVILFLILTPVLTLLAGLGYHAIPKKYKGFIPDGWRPIILIPVIALIAYLTTKLSIPAEELLFNGNARVWLRDELGVTFDQRNALVVGIAMGFAVIPTIFSIAEDALFSVPRHLVAGSLALGANPWQTLVKVVVPTASPGIFSGVMIGMGRAVGETMIVLMATGNTPIMNMNIFEGMRTLAANIAVEMPEAEVASSHYRILFLAALVLFGFTFIANTIAEVIRHRLRKKYSSL